MNDYTSGAQYGQQMLELSNGNVLIIWQSDGQSYAKVIDISGNVVKSEFLVSS